MSTKRGLEPLFLGARRSEIAPSSAKTTNKRLPSLLAVLKLVHHYHILRLKMQRGEVDTHRKLIKLPDVMVVIRNLGFTIRVLFSSSSILDTCLLWPLFVYALCAFLLFSSHNISFWKGVQNFSQPAQFFKRARVIVFIFNL